MKALSLRQPWAWLVLHAQKSIENRRWNTKFRGEFLVHAAKGMTMDEYAYAAIFAQRAGVTSLALPHVLERGGIVGVARLVDVHKPGSLLGGPWHMREQFGFVLEDVRPLPFTPCKGALGFFGVPADVEAKVRRAE